MKRGEHGQLLIEAALLTPILLLLIFIALDLGLLLSHRATLDFAVREGSQEAAAGVPAATVQAIAAARSGGLLTAEEVEVCLVDDQHVKVGASWSWRWLSGPLAAALGGDAITDLTLHPSATRRIDLDQGPTPEPGVTPDPPVTPEPLPPCD